jgi:glycosyltransferase involved in cell wall biosynthesis
MQLCGSLMMQREPSPIRVLHVITRLILGGAQQNTLSTAIGQHRDPRFDVTLMCGIDNSPEGDLHEEAHASGVRLVIEPLLVRPIRPLTDLRALWRLYRFMRRERFDVVHTHSSKAGILGRLAARLAGVPVVIHTLHSLVFHEYQHFWKNWIYIWLKRACAPLTDSLISVNEGTSRTALARGIGRPDQHVTIYSGMELQPFLAIGETLSPEQAKARLGIPPGAPVMGKVARLFTLKGHDHFFDAAAEVARLEPAAWFLVVGDGVLRASLEARARVLGIGDRTVFAGRVNPRDVAAHIQAMDVLVHTSLREGIARVLPQAGAVGKPVVTFRLDGAPEVIRDGVSGFLVAALDSRAVADRVVTLFNDGGLRARMGARGRAFAAEHFGVESMVSRINDVYWRHLSSRAVGTIAHPIDRTGVDISRP